MAERRIGTSTYSGKPLFKGGSKRAEITRYYCKLEGECPVLARGECIHANMFDSCVYGRRCTETGPTTKAAKYASFIKNAEAERAQHPSPKSAPQRMAYIGDYVWLPYTHMTMVAEVPFLRHSQPFVGGGLPFIKREHFTPQTIKTLCDARPRAIFDNMIIPSYPKESIPTFLRDLRGTDRQLFDETMALYPELAEHVAPPQSLLGKCARLGDLPHGNVKILSHTYRWDPATGTLSIETCPILGVYGNLTTVVADQNQEVTIVDENMVIRLPETLHVR